MSLQNPAEGSRKRTSQKGGFSTLTPLLKYFNGIKITVELKNGNAGLLHDVDDYMNLVLHRARTEHDRNKPHKDDFVHLSRTPTSTMTSFRSNGESENMRTNCGSNEETRTHLDERNSPTQKGRTNHSMNAVGRQTLEDIDFRLLHIKGPRIRYVHLPENADLPQLIKVGLERERLAKQKYARHKMRAKDPRA